MNANMLRTKIIERGFLLSEISEVLGLDTWTTYQKLNAHEKLTINEAVQLKHVLGLSNAEAIDIFFEV